MQFICIAETGITSVTVYDLIKQSLKKYGPKNPIIPSYNNQHSHSYFMFKIDRKSRKWLPCNLSKHLLPSSRKRQLYWSGLTSQLPTL